ncbi:MAG: tetratricopeptide repeat protein [Thermomicrobiales bacterium]|nr:tetratricopeptide repeat protein [Thermomicrobiales bacterium]
MTKRSSSRQTQSVGFIVIAILIVAVLVLGALAAILPIGGSNGEQSVDEPSIQVTPGAEVEKLQTQVAENPDDVDTVVILADVLANSGRVEESYAWFERAVNSRPDDADLRLAFGRALLRGERWFDAEIQLNRANDLDDSNATTAFYLGQLAEQRPGGDLGAARTWYQEAIDRDAQSFVAQQAKSRLDALDGSPASPTASPGA